MEDRPTGTVAFLFTDLVGSTRLWEERADDMDRALADHDEMLRAAIAAADGYVFATGGDAFAAAFHTCDAAATAAASIHQRLAGHVWPEATELAVRVGLHVGDPRERDGNYYGPVLNRTARLMASASGGQTVATDAFHRLLGADLAAHAIDLGEHRLKDLSAPERIWQLGAPVSFPPLDTLDPVRHNLSVERTPLVGRIADVDRVVTATADARLVSVLGIGGIGKTRVATAAAAEVASSFADGVWFVDLVPVSDEAGIATAMAAAAGVQLGGDDLVAALSRSIERKEVMFVVDNCEHVTDAAADVVEALLDRTTAARFLITSREPLQLHDEVQVLLPPLEVGTSGRTPALSLFIDAASRVGHDVDDAQLETVREICEHLDGHPLSIELAAAQLKQLSPRQLADRLGERFELLARGRRGRRHASLIAVLEDTWEMLETPERGMLLQLAAFPTTFALDDVEGVCRTLAVGLPSRTLGGLVDRNVVTQIGDGRYRLLETVKLFARRQWSDEDPLDRHERWLRDHLDAQSDDARYVDFRVGRWITDHWDDWRAVERRIVDSGRWHDLGDLVSRSQVAFHATLGGARALPLGLRFIDHLAAIPPEMHDVRGALSIGLANLGLPARRPDWIEHSSLRALEHLATGSPTDRAYALVLASWPHALRDTDTAVAMVERATELAEAHDALRVADVALAYLANHLAVAGRREAAADALRRLRERTDVDVVDGDYGAVVCLMIEQSLYVVTDPAASANACHWLTAHTSWDFRLLTAGACGATGDLDLARRHWIDTISRADRLFADDGLPDLLIAPAATAYGVGDMDRCRRWLTAIRRFGRPTQNFLVTLMYRELRNAVGLADANPLDRASGRELLTEADEWMRSLGEG